MFPSLLSFREAHICDMELSRREWGSHLGLDSVCVAVFIGGGLHPLLPHRGVGTQFNTKSKIHCGAHGIKCVLYVRENECVGVC